jgi:hypothetical protein
MFIVSPLFRSLPGQHCSKKQKETVSKEAASFYLFSFPSPMFKMKIGSSPDPELKLPPILYSNSEFFSAVAGINGRQILDYETGSCLLTTNKPL